MVTCKICNKQFKILSSHVSFKHKMSKEDYMLSYPGADWISKDESAKISSRLRERHAIEKEKDYEKYIATRKRVCQEMRDRKGDNWRHTEETKEKMRISHTGQQRGPHTEKTRKKISEARKGKKISLDHATKEQKRKKQKESWRKRKQDSETYNEYLSKLSDRRKEYIKQNGNPAIQKSETSIEIACRDFLDRNDIKYFTQYILEGKQYDFFLPEENLLLEVDGEYWHRLEPSIRNDIEKHQIAAKHNLNILRISSDNLDFSVILKTLDEQIYHTTKILENRGINLSELQ